MTRSIIRSICFAVGLFVVPGRLLAVWPPETVLEAESAASSSSAKTQALPSVMPRDMQGVSRKLEEDERRLAGVIQDLKDDEAALKKLSREHPDTHGESHP
jgi:hypothetical protein